MAYKVSDKTKDTLIQTAGRLMADRGVNNVSAKEIPRHRKWSQTLSHTISDRVKN